MTSLPPNVIEKILNQYICDSLNHIERCHVATQNHLKITSQRLLNASLICKEWTNEIIPELKLSKIYLTQKCDDSIAAVNRLVERGFQFQSIVLSFDLLYTKILPREEYNPLTYYIRDCENLVFILDYPILIDYVVLLENASKVIVNNRHAAQEEIINCLENVTSLHFGPCDNLLIKHNYQLGNLKHLTIYSTTMDYQSILHLIKTNPFLEQVVIKLPAYFKDNEIGNLKLNEIFNLLTPSKYIKRLTVVSKGSKAYFESIANFLLNNDTCEYLEINLDVISNIDNSMSGVYPYSNINKVNRTLKQLEIKNPSKGIDLDLYELCPGLKDFHFHLQKGVYPDQRAFKAYLGYACSFITTPFSKLSSIYIGNGFSMEDYRIIVECMKANRTVTTFDLGLLGVPSAHDYLMEFFDDNHPTITDFGFYTGEYCTDELYNSIVNNKTVKNLRLMDPMSNTFENVADIDFIIDLLDNNTVLQHVCLYAFNLSKFTKDADLIESLENNKTLVSLQVMPNEFDDVIIKSNKIPFYLPNRPFLHLVE
ncbi:hypothetical protein CYY_009515 [Polysphondylium violaceum]|uniref:F-box domain-containing protein n=1 Tax=Polysphondylium violaceum TaxID=133409 RepID=A0A8J4V2V9_9MYCE|nr:hypothetical protein CYY_009515 [Polysphondylium violaceum]